MKRLCIYSVVLLFSGIVVFGCSKLAFDPEEPSNTQSGEPGPVLQAPNIPTVTVGTLLAGGTTNVGNVSVSEAGTDLIVKYALTAPDWCLSETHLHVAANLADIPQTKKGNPMPGHFEYKSEHACETEFSYTVPIDAAGTTIYIAAHAVVANTSSEETMQVSGSLGDAVYGPFDMALTLTDDWGVAGAAVEASNLSGTPWPSIASAMWISTAAQTENWQIDTWRRLSKQVDVPGYPVSGSLQVGADDTYESYLNGSLVGSDATVSDIETYSIIPQSGSNVFDFIVKNTGDANGDQISNPNGLTFLIDVSYNMTESAWAADQPFPGKNWSMYFIYTIGGGSLTL